MSETSLGQDPLWPFNSISPTKKPYSPRRELQKSSTGQDFKLNSSTFSSTELGSPPVMNRIEDRALGNSYAFCEDEEEEIPTIKDGIEIPTPLVNCPNSPSSVLTPTKYTKEKFWVREKKKKEKQAALAQACKEKVQSKEEVKSSIDNNNNDQVNVVEDPIRDKIMTYYLALVVLLLAFLCYWL